MEEDEEEMHQEARSRLASTEGKIAKRKVFELKAAGLGGSPDLDVEPSNLFSKQPPEPEPECELEPVGDDGDVSFVSVLEIDELAAEEDADKMDLEEDRK